MENTTKKEVVTASQNNSEYKPLRDLKDTDLKALDFGEVILRKNSYKGMDTYSWIYKVGPLPLETRKFDVVGYLSILDCFKRDVSQIKGETSVPCRVRYIVIKGKDGRFVHQIQFVFGYRTFLTRLVNDNEFRLIESYIKQGKVKSINWIEKPEDDVDVGDDVSVKGNEDNEK